MRGVIWPDECALCRHQGRIVQDTRIHAWQCPMTRLYAIALLEKLEDWLVSNWYKRRTDRDDIKRELWSASHIVVWPMATTTEGMKKEKMPVSTQDSVGGKCIKKVLDASIDLYEYRAQQREKILQAVCETGKSLRQMMMDTLMGKDEEGAEAEVEDKHED